MMFMVICFWLLANHKFASTSCSNYIKCWCVSVVVARNIHFLTYKSSFQQSCWTLTMFHIFFFLYCFVMQKKAMEVRSQKTHLKKIEDLGAAMEERLILDNRYCVLFASLTLFKFLNCNVFIRILLQLPFYQTYFKHWDFSWWK